MRVFTFRSLVTLAVVSGGAFAVVAACSDNSSTTSSNGATSGENGSGSGGGGGSGSVGTSGNGGGGSGSTMSSSGTSSDGGAMGISADALITYDGPPPNVDGGQLSCSTPNGLSIKFNPIYSGFDGMHLYQVPVFVEGVSPATVTWGSSDPSMVDLSPYVSGVMITTKKAGDVTIVAKTSSTCGSAPLHIAQYTVDQWNTGNDRYHNGHALVGPDASIPDGAPRFDGSLDARPPFDGSFDAAAVCGYLKDAGYSTPFTMNAPACTNCHGMGSNGMLFGMTLYSDIAHTPEQTGGFSEDELTNVIVNGVIPDGGTFDPTIAPYCIWQLIHQWNDIDTPDKQAGMRAYLRSLTPQEQTGCFELFNANLCADAGLGD